MQTSLNPVPPGGNVGLITSTSKADTPRDKLILCVDTTIRRLRTETQDSLAGRFPAHLNAEEVTATLLKCAGNSRLDFSTLDQHVTRSLDDQGLEQHQTPLSLVLASLPSDAWRQLEKTAGGEVTEVVLPDSMAGDPKRATQLEGLKDLKKLQTLSLAIETSPKDAEQEIDLTRLPSHHLNVVLRAAGDGPVAYRAHGGVKVSVVDEYGTRLDESRLHRRPADAQRPDELRPSTVAWQHNADTLVDWQALKNTPKPEPVATSRAAPDAGVPATQAPLKPPAKPPVPPARQGFFSSLMSGLTRWLAGTATPATQTHRNEPVWRAVRDMQSRFFRGNVKLQTVEQVAKRGFSDDSLRMLLAADRFVQAGTKPEFRRMMQVFQKEQANIGQGLFTALNRYDNDAPFPNAAAVHAARDLATKAGIEFYTMLSDNVKTTSKKQLELTDLSRYRRAAAP